MPIIFNQPETSTSHSADRPPWFWTDPFFFFFFLTAYINTSQLISNTTIPNDNMFHTPRNPKPRKPRTALVSPVFIQQIGQQRCERKVIVFTMHEHTYQWCCTFKWQGKFLSVFSPFLSILLIVSQNTTVFTPWCEGSKLEYHWVLSWFELLTQLTCFIIKVHLHFQTWLAVWTN